MTVELEGVERFSATIGQAQRQLQDLSDPGRTAIEQLEAKAIASAPVDTGELVAAFGTRITTTDAELVNNAPHAIFQQFGTVHHAAQPFMPDQRALERAAVPVYHDYLDTTINKIQGI